ncbi:T-cell surface antigen CD2 [Chanodichthys erythropterus]|uniref:T-cell surface antigen CD2 n=1 Tax=Chanodichthys erythropterus TaxID=933992 RepID=UPI00351F6844
MSCQHNLLFLLLCGFAALSVSVKICEKELLVETSCIIKLTSENNGKPAEIKWTHDRNGKILAWRDGDIKTKVKGVSKEEDGSLRIESVSLKDTGTYTYIVSSSDGTEIGKGNWEIKVYEKAPKPVVKIENCNTTATLTCNTGNRKDLTVSWFEEDKPILKDKNTLLLTPTQLQGNKRYSCEARNPVSKDKSESIPVSCAGPGLTKLFGFDFWLMVGILAGGGALLLLLICVLVICACRSCHQRTKRIQDEEEFRLADLTPAPTGTNRSKQTARGQPAPPIPQEDPMPCNPSPETPPRTQNQPKAQIRARPPPPPQDDDEEDPPPLPRPRNKQHRTKRNQEPYRPME